VIGHAGAPCPPVKRFLPLVVLVAGCSTGAIPTTDPTALTPTTPSDASLVANIHHQWSVGGAELTCPSYLAYADSRGSTGADEFMVRGLDLGGSSPRVRETMIALLHQCRDRLPTSSPG